MRSGFDLRLKGRCWLAGFPWDRALGTRRPSLHIVSKREDRIVLIRHRLVGDKALGYRLLSRAACPGACPHGRAFDPYASTSLSRGPLEAAVAWSGRAAHSGSGADDPVLCRGAPVARFDLRSTG